MRIRVLRSLSLVAATIAGVIASGVATPVPVAADCASQPTPPDRVGVAFKGSVVRVEEVRDRLYAVTVDVERTLAGPMRRTQTFETGDYADCYMIDGSAIHEGDELVVVGTSWWKPRTLAYPFAWRAVRGGRWDLSVIARDNRRRLPADLRAVNTYSEMLAFIGAGLPPTEAEPIASTSPGPTMTTELSTVGVAEDELFRLAIETPTTTYTVGEAIPISTTLTYIGAAPTVTVTHAFGGVVGFGVEQLDGPLDADPGRRMSCVSETFATGDIQVVPFSKSGGYGKDDPLAPMWDAWLHDPLVRPPAGTYRIDAVAEYGSAGCGNEMMLTASVTIEVTGHAVDPSAPEVVAVLTDRPVPSGQIAVCAAAQLFGTLVADERWGIAIVSDVDGRVVRATWPSGWSARRDSTGLALLDASGVVMAREGDHVELGGGEDTAHDWHTCGDPGLVLLP